MSNKTVDVLKEIFGHTGFRPLQKEAVDTTLQNRDLLMILPTGGGKSLCYQLPALLKKGVTVVVSPLLALMHDQVRALKMQGIAAEMIGSMQTPQEIGEIVTRLRNGELKLLYVAPERFSAYGFLDLLKSIPIASFVIDEAHCVSEWGHEFREDYRRLHLLKEQFPNVPVSAFTATATSQVEADIVRQLGLKSPVRLRGSVYRENLLVRAEPRIGDGKRQLSEFLERFEGESGIVYTFTRNSAETVAAYLQKSGIKAMAYHAGLPKEERQAAYRAFVHDEAAVIVATVAFGMGIDKSNIRYVVHMSMPKTLENYYQEIGRAGRDGLPSETLLLYSAADAAQRASLIEGLEEGGYRQSAFDKLEKMVGYCRSESCRHLQLADYFGESMDACGTKCDNCTAPTHEQRDITIEARKLLSAIYRTSQRFGKNHIIELLRGSENRKILQFGHERLSVYGIGKELTKAQWEVVTERLQELGALARGEHRNFTITEIGAEILKGGASVSIKASRLDVQEKRKRTQKADMGETGDFDREIFDELRRVRKAIADENQVPAYIVFGDKTLKEMAAKLPRTKEQMLEISGIGEVKFSRFGEPFLERCRELAERVPVQEA
ncbi:DNA helicase RecQ [Hydrogenimonas cancrithermarum]|uniref:DNA helicase RecQ n=1 Tax=Hydrogenimonas cancrithermarum TaxID=2993563 RepID=A0ABM8FN31_9BACT|nr:DNA helicase RecQ [Hydrogenimonas cancrithermarum]BDY13707.1 ATP-dependent DNA helicase RecQ [Hydrogenimonas cancrithermarum]